MASLCGCSMCAASSAVFSQNWTFPHETNSEEQKLFSTLNELGLTLVKHHGTLRLATEQRQVLTSALTGRLELLPTRMQLAVKICLVVSF